MTSKLVSSLRSVALDVPDLQRAEEFYTRTWHLDVAARSDDAIYLRATGTDHHLIAFHRSDRTQIRNVTFRARNADALRVIAGAISDAGGAVLDPIGPVDEPGGGVAVTISDPDGRVLRVVHNDDVYPT